MTLAADALGSAPVDKIRWQLDRIDVLEESDGVHEGDPGDVVTISETGVYTLNTWAVDTVGNISADRPATVRIDFKAPSDTTVCPSAAIAVGHKIPVTVTDADSGLAGVYWRVDGVDGSVRRRPSRRGSICSKRAPKTSPATAPSGGSAP